MLLKCGQTIGVVRPCIVTQGEKGQAPVMRSDTKQSITSKINAADTGIGSASVERKENAGQLTVYS